MLNADRLGWLGCERSALEENGFVVAQGYAQQISEVYQQAAEAGWPLFLTTAALLHTHYVLYDSALRLAEMERFVGDLEELTLAMLDASVAQYGSALYPRLVHFSATGL